MPIMLGAYLHQLDPFAIEIYDSIGIRWYGLSYAIGFVAVYFITTTMAKRKLTPMPQMKVMDFLVAMVLGTMIGGRLGYCLFYDPSLFSLVTDSVPYWGVLAVHKGGMASHGGMIGIMVACIWFAKKHDLPRLHIFDLTVLGGTIGVCLGRIANFINGELVGRPCEKDFALGVQFPQDLYDWPIWLDPKVPVVEKVYTADALHQLTDAAMVVNENLSANQWHQAIETFSTHGIIIASKADQDAYGMIGRTISKIVYAAQHQNAKVIETLTQVLVPRHPSQLYASFLEGALLLFILGIAWRKPRKPGVIAGIFVVCYAVVRIINEQFRMPDSGIGFQALGLTRGQWLSVGMLSIGVVMLAMWSRRKVDTLGGWGEAYAPVLDNESETKPQK